MTRSRPSTYRARYLRTAVALSLLTTCACGSQDDAALEPGEPAHADAGAATSSTIADASVVTNGHEPSEASSEAPTVDAGSARADASVAAPVWLDAGEKDPVEFASGLDGLFLDVPCTGDTATPLAKGATCAHVAMTQRIERKLQFGGEPGRVYRVRLRVRGIWEPTSIVGGTRPVQELPYTVGGTVATGAGDPINYQQYSIRISEPRQVYWLNDYRYVAHDIHKEDYELELQITAGADVTVGMNDGNDHQIANWTRDLFQGLAPYATKPSTGQLLRLDVLAVDPL